MGFVGVVSQYEKISKVQAKLKVEKNATNAINTSEVCGI
jgi:hypothetical protein